MIYAVVGPTGVGKTKLSILLAEKLNAEIINCDSMQIYKEFNIGVAKVQEEETHGIPHHLLSIISIKDDFSVYDYKKLAIKTISDITSRGKNVIFVGGTGLYLKAVLDNYSFNNKPNNQKQYQYKIIALTMDREKLYEKINERVDKMLEIGLMEEVKNLYDQNIRSRAVLTAIGYKELYEYFDNKITKEQAIEKIKLNSRRYAKRQYTFFKNQFSYIKWYDVTQNTYESIVSTIISEEK